MCLINSFLDDKEEDKLIGPMDTSADMITGTADGVVLDAVDGRAAGIDCNPLGGGTASWGRSLDISAIWMFFPLIDRTGVRPFIHSK